MAKKQTFAAVMKQLSNKKGSYEKGLEEARRVGNPSGIRDYERRLAKLSAGMDELFQTQQMMNGGNTNVPKAVNGTQTAPGSVRASRNIPADGSYPGAAVNDKGEYMLMKDHKGNEFLLTEEMVLNANNGAFGQRMANGYYNDQMIFFDDAVYKGVEKPAPVDEPKPVATETVEADAAGDPVRRRSSGPSAEEKAAAEAAAARSASADLGMAGARATSGIDPNVFGTSGTGVQLPGLDTMAGPGALPGVFGIAEQMGAFNAPAKTTVENASGTDAVADADKSSSSAAQDAVAKAGKALGNIGLGGKGLGMALGAAAQFIPDLRSMKAMGDIEGPAMMPTRNPLTMNTDIQTGRALQDIRNQTALSNASVDANISNPAVAAAAKRANQRVEQGQLGNVLFNEAQKENELRNQNLRQLQDTQYANQMTNYQNRMNQINFDNERIAAENRMRGQMSQKLGAAFGDFQNRAQDMKKWDLVRKLDQYGVIGRNNIDPTS